MSAELARTFPGFKIIRLSGGFRVQCRGCFKPASANWCPPSVFAANIPAVRRWIDEHVHLLTFEQARTESLTAATSGHKGAKQWLADKGLINRAPDGSWDLVAAEGLRQERDEREGKR